MNLLEFNFPEWFFVALNLIVLMVILRKFLWKPINEVLDKRAKIAADTAQAAQSIELETQELEKERQKAKEAIEQSTNSSLKDARVRAGKEYDRIIAEAESKATAIVSAGHLQGARDREAIVRDANAEVISLALSATKALLCEQIDDERGKVYLENLLSRRGVK